MVHDAAGPVEQPDNVRVYWIPGSQHQPEKHDAGAIARQPGNPQQYGPIIRALIVALDEWCSGGAPPPESRHGTVADGTLLPPQKAAAAFPAIPGFACTGLHNELRVLDHATIPPTVGAAYPVLVNTPDADGNGIAGVRHPLLPLAQDLPQPRPEAIIERRHLLHQIIQGAAVLEELRWKIHLLEHV